MSLCLAAAGLAVEIAAASFTLSWTHTIEKTEWREDWRVEADQLILAEARVKGSGAGMEPPPDAHLVAGFYLWEPNLPHREVLLRGYSRAGDWLLCAGGRCATLREWLGGVADPVRLYPAVDGGCALAASD